MRRRLVLSSVALLAVALLAFMIPLGLAIRGTLVDRALDTLSAEMQQLGGFIDASRTCGDVQLRLGLLSETTARDTSVALLADGGRVVVARDGRAEVIVGAEAASAFTGVAGQAFREGRLAVAVPLDTRACATPLVLQADRDPGAVQGEVRRAWLGLGALALVVLGLGVGAANLLARRLAAPLEDLASSAAALGDGDVAGRAPRSGYPEMDRIADALELTADRLGRALARSATFAMDASHQLRTPLTALRLHLDALEASGADPSTLAAAQAEADRLQATIDELETLTRTDVDVHEVDLGDVVQRRLPAWHAMARQRGRSITFERHRVPLAAVRGAAIGQAVQVLLDNALVHGRGRITVRVRPDFAQEPAVRTTADGDVPRVSAVRVDVLDEGPGPVAGSLDEDRRDGGRGLPLARSLVEAEGGRVSVIATADGGTCAGIVIPVRAADDQAGVRPL
jgi:signal transduction histidine kinase